MSDDETKAASPKAEADANAKPESDKDTDTKKTAKKAAKDDAVRSVGLHRE